MKKTALLTAIFTLFLLFSLSASAENETTELTVISFRGGGNASVEDVAADFENGADMVSVSVFSEVEPYMGRNIGSEERMDFIASIIKIVPDGKAIILDDAWELRDEIEKLAESLDAADKIVLRTKESTNDLQNESLSLRTVSVYSGGIVFSAEQRIRFAKPSNILQFQSKNYFNPFYQKIFSKHFSVPVIAPMFDKDLCGQRTDGVVGWDEMIERGFSCIETANPEGLVNYKNEIEKQRSVLKGLSSEYKELVKSSGRTYSSASLKKLSDACAKAEKLLGRLSSLGELQSCTSEMKNARRKLALSDGKDETLGAWNVTAGKVIASVLCAVGLIGFEVFIVWKRKR